MSAIVHGVSLAVVTEPVRSNPPTHSTYGPERSVSGGQFGDLVVQIGHGAGFPERHLIVLELGNL